MQSDIIEACRFATSIAALNKHRRFAYSDNGHAVAVHEGDKFVACYEKVITGQWVYGGLDVKRNWIEVT